ncbi:MAG: membrane protein insertase YidC, partial [Acetobacteraceae bacterium]
MDQTRLLLAIVISIAILIGFQMLLPHPPPVHHPAPAQQVAATTKPVATEPQAASPSAASPSAAGPSVRPARKAPQLAILAPAVKGSIDLDGARLDQVVLRDYHVTVAKNSPNVEVLGTAGGPRSYYVQFGWSAAPGEDVKLPGDDTLWKASPGPISPGRPVTLSWDNGAGQLFRLVVDVDD